MAFRLTVFPNPDVTIVRLIGRLGNEQVARATDVCNTARRPLVLDLSHLMHASDAGACLLRRLAAGGAHLIGASPYIELLVADSAEAPPRASRRAPRGSGV